MRLKLALSLARAETRSARGALLFCVLSVAIGAFAVTSIRVVSSSLMSAMGEQARQLQGADLKLEANRPLSSEAGEQITRELLALGARSVDSVRFNSMLSRLSETRDTAGAEPGDRNTALVRVRAVGEGFPFYGRIETSPPGLWGKLADAPSVLVDPNTAQRLGLVPGSTVQLGKLEATVLGQFVKEPGSPAAEFGLTPFLYLHQSYVPATELLQTGSRVEYERLFALPPTVTAEALKERYWETALASNVEIKTFAEASENVQRFMARLTRFVALVGLITLFLGSLGVGSAFNAFVRTKVEHVAILRCVGATPRGAVFVYGLLAVALATFGSALGAGLGAMVPGLLRGPIERLGSGYLPAGLELSASWVSVARGFATSIWAALVFTLLPLVNVARVSPLSALRREQAGVPRPTAAVYAALAALVLGWTALITGAETSSVEVGFWFTGATLLSLLALVGLAQLGMTFGRRLGSRFAGFSVRSAFANLHRPQNQTRQVIVAVGVGFFLLSTLLTVRATLGRALSVEADGRLPTLFAVDIQPDQKQEAERVLERHGAAEVMLSPMISARIAAVDGRPLERDEIERHAGQRSWQDRMRTREYFVTYREQLLPSERLEAGRFWTGSPELPEASIDVQVADALQIELGSTLTLDISGLPFEARVTSHRQIRWQALQPNSLIVLSPGAIESAPKMYILAARVPEQATRYALQDELVKKLPNVTVIDVADAANSVLSISNKVSAIFAVVGILAALTGSIILAGAISAGYAARQRESALLRVLGASSAQLRRLLITEYALLAALGTAGGWLLSELTSRVLMQRLFEVSAVVPYGQMLWLALFSVGLNTLVGLLVGRHVSRNAPRDLLGAT